MGLVEVGISAGVGVFAIILGCALFTEDVRLREIKPLTRIDSRMSAVVGGAMKLCLSRLDDERLVHGVSSRRNSMGLASGTIREGEGR